MNREHSRMPDPLVDLYLWRGHRLLGRIRLRDDTGDGQLAGILLPDCDRRELRSAMQTRVSLVSGERVFESPIEPDARYAGPVLEQDPTSSPMELRRLSDVEALGIVPEAQLRIRGGDGAELRTQFIMLRETQPTADVPTHTLAGASSVTGESVWGVVAMLDPNG